MQDGQILNHFSQFDSRSVYQPEASPVLPTGSRAVGQPPATHQYPNMQMQMPAGDQFAQFSNYINSTITSQNDKINTLSSNLERLILAIQGTQQPQQYSQPQEQAYSEWNAAARDKLQKGETKGAFAGPNQSYPIKDREDVKNAWNLAGRTKTGNPDGIRRKVISIAKRMGMASALPKAAKDWAKTNGISLSDDQPELRVFSTSANISDTDKAFLDAASAVVDRLSDPEDLFSFYGIIKNSLKHLDAPTYEQVMSDFCATASEPVEEVDEPEPAVEEPDTKAELLSDKPETDSAINSAFAGISFTTIDELMTDEEIEELIAEDIKAESSMPKFSEVDSELWAMAQSVAKRRSGNSDNITDAQVSSIYEVLAEAKRHKAKAMACADEPSQSNQSGSKFKDKTLYSQALRSAKQKYKEDWPSAYASGYLVRLYKSMYQDKHGSLKGAFADEYDTSNLSEDLLSELTIES